MQNYWWLDFMDTSNKSPEKKKLISEMKIDQNSIEMRGKNYKK